VKEAGINLYSMEELCYFLNNNIYMIDNDFFNGDLIDFIENGLELADVSKKLKDQIYRQESFISMIKTVFDGCYYYSESEKEEILKNLEKWEDKSPVQRMKSRADMMAETGKFNTAIELYKKIIKKSTAIKDKNTAACATNNIGVIYMKQFLFKDASECFKRAYELQKEDEYMDNIICTAILMKDGKELEDIKAQYQITDDTVSRYEKAIELAEKEIRSKKEVMDMAEKFNYGSDMELSSFYEQCGMAADMWKKEYREQIQ
jgi:tetratricopeptide (TPR) repeat protein